jgi:hypothetical protein
VVNPRANRNYRDPTRHVMPGTFPMASWTSRELSAPFCSALCSPPARANCPLPRPPPRLSAEVIRAKEWLGPWILAAWWSTELPEAHRRLHREGQPWQV